jgi:hypothetical protein
VAPTPILRPTQSAWRARGSSKSPKAEHQFVQAELADHTYVIVLHDVRNNPYMLKCMRGLVECRPVVLSAQGRSASMSRAAH